MTESDCPPAECTDDEMSFTGLNIPAPGNPPAGRSRRRHANIDAAETPRSRQYADTGNPLSRCCAISFPQRVAASSLGSF